MPDVLGGAFARVGHKGVMRASSVAACLAVLSCSAALGQSPLRETEPGEGAYCGWAIYTAMLEVGTRCHAGDDVEVQRELARSVSRIEAYVIANSNPSPTAEEIENFKREQGAVGRSLDNLCHGDAEEMYRSVVALGSSNIRESVDALVARPGPPTWGTCL